MGRKNKKRSKKRSYKYAVKRSTPSRKSIGRTFKKLALSKRKIKARDVGRAIKKARRSRGGIPRIPGIMAGKMEQRHSAAGRAQQQKRRDAIYGKLDGGTESTRYISGPAPRGKSRKSKKRDKETYNSSSYQPQYSDTSYDSGYNDQIMSMMEMLRMQQEDFNQRYGQQQMDYQSMFDQYQQQAADAAAAAEQRYQEMIAAQKEAAEKAAKEREERARQDAISRQTMIANQLRASAGMPQLKIGAPNPTGIGGTSDFKRRLMQGTGMTLGGINV